jgi:hypothetical protein
MPENRRKEFYQGSLGVYALRHICYKFYVYKFTIEVLTLFSMKQKQTGLVISKTRKRYVLHWRFQLSSIEHLCLLLLLFLFIVSASAAALR